MGVAPRFGTAGCFNSGRGEGVEGRGSCFKMSEYSLFSLLTSVSVVPRNCPANSADPRTEIVSHWEMKFNHPTVKWKNLIPL